MIILQALLSWLLISFLILGGVSVFRRFCPEESPWLGFFVPALIIVALLNFIEHLVALPTLLPLLPVAVAGLGWFFHRYGVRPGELALPGGIFLGAFAFTFFIRCLDPNIQFTSDGISDLNMINNFSQGEKLPPTDTWMPPFHFEWYYSFQHYSASVVKRLLAVKIGLAYNLSHALLSALTVVAAAGAAWRLSGGRTWITLATVLLIESAATGSGAYLFLTSHNPSVWTYFDLSGGVTKPPDDNPIWKFLAGDTETLRLQPPGVWTWRDEYHANAAGHLLTLLGLLVVAELAEVRRTIVPWVLAAVLPMLAVMASAWALPIVALVAWGGLGVALLCGRRPEPMRTLWIALGAALIVLWPAFYEAGSSPQAPLVMWTKPEWRTPLREFLVQWWPIVLLWLGALCTVRQVSFAVRWMLVVVPVMFLGIEIWNVDADRYNMIEKMWGYTYGLGLIAFFPVVAARPGPFFRGTTGLILISAWVSFYSLFSDAWKWAPKDDFLHLEGHHYITSDDQKRRIFEVVSQLKRATFLSGKSDYCYYEAPAITSFTGNRSYIAWFTFEGIANYTEESLFRHQQDLDFYSGANTDPLGFLRGHKIDGVFIWPDDTIADDALAKLRSQLEPAYEYIDCRGNGSKNAGVFLKRAG